MGDVVTDRTSNYDGSGSPETGATGPIIVTFSGTVDSTKKNHPVLNFYSRGGTADYVLTLQMTSFGRYKINLAAGDDFYFTANGIGAGDSVDINWEYA